MHVPLQALRPGELTSTRPAESSSVVQRRVEAAHQRQQQRSGASNARLAPTQLQRFCALSAANREFLEATLQQLRLSARAYHRILKVARTIADLAEADAIERPHLAEAIGLRGLDRPG